MPLNAVVTHENETFCHRFGWGIVNIFGKTAALVLLVSFLTTAAWAIPAGIDQPNKPRYVNVEPTDGASATNLIRSSYGDVLSSLGNTEAERERLTIRLAIAYRLFNRGLGELGGQGNSTDGRFYAPSPEALLRVEGMLPTVPAKERAHTSEEYVKQLEPRLTNLGPAAYKELMGYVANETTQNKALFPEDTVAKANAITSDQDTDGDVMARRVTGEINVPDGDATDIDSDQYTAPGNLVDTLPNSTSSSLDPNVLATMSERQLKDMIASLQGSYNPQAQSNLAVLQAALAKVQQEKALQGTGDNGTLTGGNDGNDVTTTVATGNDGSTVVGEDVALADVRASDIDKNMGSAVRVSPWFDATLRNLTDFFHTGKEEEDDDENTVGKVYDPLTGQEVKKDELDFEGELVQFGADEGISQRGVDER